MKTVNTKEYIDQLVSIIQEGKQVSLPINGTSMEPFLKNGRDSVLLANVTADYEIRSGDVLLYTRLSGQYILHRVHKIKNGKLTMLGDNQLKSEQINREQIRAVVIEVKRKQRILNSKSLTWLFFSGPWNRWLVLRMLLGNISKAKRGLNGLV